MSLKCLVSKERTIIGHRELLVSQETSGSIRSQVDYLRRRLVFEGLVVSSPFLWTTTTWSGFATRTLTLYEESNVK